MTHEEMTLNTKKALATALKRALEKKPFQKITVSELIQDCSINRKTFYYHFEDIYALLKWMLEEESIAVVRHFDLLTDYEEAVSFVMDYVDENDYILNCIYNSVSLDELNRFFIADFMEISRTVIEQVEIKSHKPLDSGYKNFLCHFYASAVAGLLITWVKDRQKQNREAIMQYLTSAIRDSLTGIFQSTDR